MVSGQAVALELLSFDCYPVFLDKELSQKFYQGEPSHPTAAAFELSRLFCVDSIRTAARMRPHSQLLHSRCPDSCVWM